MTTEAIRGNNVLKGVWPAFMRRKPKRLIPDGDLELDATYQIYHILLPLSSDAQQRAIEHVVKILNERAAALNGYDFEEN